MPPTRRAARWLLGLAPPVLLGTLLASAPARANGRFPRADQLVLAPGNADELWLRTTFGLLVSRDAGASWDWVCERALGFSGSEDPPLQVLPNGVVLAGLLEGLVQSGDRGCSWQFAALPGQQLPIIDLSARREPPSLAVALAWEQQAASASAPGYRARFFASADGGAQWQPRGVGIDPGVLVLTLDVAPSDPQRLYASGIRNGAARSAALFVSNDAGTSWTEHVVPFDARSEQGLYIAAVDPFSPDLLYLRTSGASASRLFVSTDAGASFAERYAGEPLLGFALSPDGAQIYIGGDVGGLSVAARGDFVFEQRSALPIVCLAATADTLYACSNERGGFALGASRDGGASFQPLLVLSDVRGPLTCPSSASLALCAADWPALSDRLGIEPRPTAPGADTPAEPRTSSAAANGAGGCTVRQPQRGGPPQRGWTFAIALGVAAVLRRRRRAAAAIR